MRTLIFLFFLVHSDCIFSQEWKIFSTDSILFSANYPADWVNKIKEGKRVFFTSPAESATDDFYENINISVTFNPEFGTTTKIKDVFPGVIKDLKTSLNEFVFETQRNFNWNGADAVEIIYSGYSKSNADIKVRITQRFCFYKQRLYTSTFSASFNNNKFNSIVEKIVNGIVFK